MPPFSMRERYGRGIEKIGSSLPPLGLLYLGAELENKGYGVEIFDTQVCDWDIKKVGKPDIAGIYCNTSNYRRAIELAREIKDNFWVPVVLGGPHATSRPLEVLSNEEVDYVVVGEGEKTIVELMAGADLSSIKGLGFKTKGTPVLNPRRDLIQNLDSVHFPARHLVPMDKYRPSPNQYKRLPMTTMMVSRGCPFNCTFCDSEVIWTRSYRSRSVENVIGEIKQLINDYGIREINFWDDVWGVNKKWVEEFCDAVIKEKLDLTWCCEARVNTIDRETLKKMKSAGCWCIFYGVESLDQEILDAINKRVTVEQITSALKWTKEAGLEIRANFILGLPLETPQKVKEMLKKLCKMNPDNVKFNVLTPYPETAIYKQIKNGQWGTMADESYDKLTSHLATFLPFGYKDIDELQRIKKYAYRKYYLRLGYIMPRLLSIRSFEDIKRHISGVLAIMSM